MQTDRKPVRIPRMLLVAVLALAISACAASGARRDAQRLFEEGAYAAAIEKYRLASEAAPGNVPYRQAYLTKRAEAITLLSGKADAAMAQGDLVAAERAYRTILEIDTGNAHARGRIHALDLRRRHDQQAARADELIQAGDWDEARRLVELVLQDDPSNARAMNARDRIRARDFERNASGDGLEAQFRMPVTLEFKDIPVRAVFDVLSQASGINFIYDPEIRPDARVTVQLRKTPLDEAIRIIGMSTQLETMVINANSILVFPSTPQKISEYRQLSVRSFFLDNAKASTVAETIKTILKTESLVVDENLNMLIMRDTPDAIRLAERLVQLHDTSAPEVVLEVEILEVNRTTLREMGVNLPKEIGVSVSADQSTSAWQTVDELRGINSSSLYANVPNASIKLNESTTNASILANPKIRVQNRESAKIMIGDKVPVITSTSTSTGFVSETVNYVDVGLKLEVQPTIYASNEVAMKVNLEVSRLVREIQTQSGTLSYQIGTRNAETVLRLRDGETQILAGLINQEDRRTGAGLPWLTRFPVLNRLFGTRRTDAQDTEIVLSITPRLVRGVVRADLADMLFESGTAVRLGARALSARSDIDAVQPAATAQPSAPPTVVQPTVTPLGTEPPAAIQPIPQATQSQAPARTLMGWSAPREVRVGEQFTAVLNISAMQALEQVPLMLGFPPHVLQVVSVEEGSFMNQGGGQSSLVQQVNLSEGKISATLTRRGSAVSGQGALLNVTFRALAASEGAALTILSAQGIPESGLVTTVDASVVVR